MVWPKTGNDSLRVLSTQTEHCFRLVVMTDFPEVLDSIICENAIHQGNETAGSTLPLAMTIPDAKTSWTRLPGFRAVFTVMRAPGYGTINPSDRYGFARLPEPQSLIFIKRIQQPLSLIHI